MLRMREHVHRNSPGWCEGSAAERLGGGSGEVHKVLDSGRRATRYVYQTLYFLCVPQLSYCSHICLR